MACWLVAAPKVTKPTSYWLQQRLRAGEEYITR